MAGAKNRRRLSDDARQRMGVYKSIEDVPAKYRLSRLEGEYTGRDVWSEFSDEKTERFTSDATARRYEKAGRYFKEYMADQGRHHALADPEHVEEFLVALRDGQVGRQHHTRKLQTVYFEFFQPIEEFYSWLQWHTDHEWHVYHPVLMAVVSGGFAREVWNRKLDQNDKR